MNRTPWVTPAKRGFWSRLSAWQRVGLIAAILALPCCGGPAVIGALAGDGPKPQPKDAPAAQQLADQQPAGTTPARTTASTPATTPARTTSSAATPLEAAPAVTSRTVTVRKTIAYKTTKVEDDSLAECRTKVRVKGATGVRTLTYRVTLTGGQETGRKLVSDVVTRKPVTKVIAVGTKVAEEPGGGCDPNYTPCVPVADDVDCAGGSGNGPAYVDGPVTIIGDDVYDLDRDGDGVACDS